MGLLNLVWYYQAAKLAQLSLIYSRLEKPDWTLIERQAVPTYTLDFPLWCPPKNWTPCYVPYLVPLNIPMGHYEKSAFLGLRNSSFGSQLSSPTIQPRHRHLKPFNGGSIRECTILDITYPAQAQSPFSIARTNWIFWILKNSDVTKFSIFFFLYPHFGKMNLTPQTLRITSVGVARGQGKEVAYLLSTRHLLGTPLSSHTWKHGKKIYKTIGIKTHGINPSLDPSKVQLIPC